MKNLTKRDREYFRNGERPKPLNQVKVKLITEWGKQLLFNAAYPSKVGN